MVFLETLYVIRGQSDLRSIRQHFLSAMNFPGQGREQRKPPHYIPYPNSCTQAPLIQRLPSSRIDQSGLFPTLFLSSAKPLYCLKFTNFYGGMRGTLGHS